MSRYISAGFWIKAQNFLTKGGAFIGVVGVTVLPLITYLLTGSALNTYSVMSGSVIVMLYMILASFISELFRMNGIPIIESA